MRRIDRAIIAAGGAPLLRRDAKVSDCRLRPVASVGWVSNWAHRTVVIIRSGPVRRFEVWRIKCPRTLFQMQLLRQLSRSSTGTLLGAAALRLCDHACLDSADCCPSMRSWACHSHGHYGGRRPLGLTPASSFAMRRRWKHSARSTHSSSTRRVSNLTGSRLR